MAKRFCKLNRRDITEHLGEIHNLVTEPKFVCRSCARSSADKANLCKPSAIPPVDCQTKSVAEKAACGLLAETLPTPELALADQNPVSFSEPQAEVVQIFEPSSKATSALTAQTLKIESLKDKALKKKAQKAAQVSAEALVGVKVLVRDKNDKLDRKELKRAKKSLKKREKYNKKLAKVVKQQRKLLKKSQKLESQFERMSAHIESAVLNERQTAESTKHIH